MSLRSKMRKLNGFLFLLMVSVFTTIICSADNADKIDRLKLLSKVSMGEDPLSAMPTFSPTVEPSLSPSFCPSAEPSLLPSVSPSIAPSARPSTAPSVLPSLLPSNTKLPTRVPTFPPTFRPTVIPSVRPSKLPTVLPTFVPSNTETPTIEPSNLPTVVPTTAAPTLFPVLVHTTQPTLMTQYPTSGPTVIPTVASTITPSEIPSARPTGVPTAAPTRLPTTSSPTYKTEAPTYSMDAPTIKRVFVVSTSSVSATLTVVYSDVTRYSGNLYCADFSVGSSVKTVNEIISTGVGVPFPVNVTSSSVTLTGLSALSVYDIYCVTENIFGNVNSLNQALTTKISVTAACCKSLAFTNAPSYVYGDSDYYTQGQMSSFVFAFSLSALPIDQITVTPSLMSLSTGQSLSGTVSISPPSFVFTSSSTSLSDSFVLSASNQFEDLASLSLTISGSSHSQYVTVNQSVHILSLGSFAPAPYLSSARFSSSGYNVLVTFSAATDQSGISGTSTFPCSDLLHFQSVDQGASCSWINSSVVKVDFGVISSEVQYVLVGSPISLLGGVLKAKCSSLNFTACAIYNKYAANQTVILQGPSTPIIPTVTLVVPSIISSCDNLTLNAALSTGGGGRQFTSRLWIVSGINVNDNNIAAIVNYLNSFSIDTITQKDISIPSSLLLVTAYSVSLTLTNFFGYSSSTSVRFEVSNNLNIPALSIVGGNSWTMLSSDELIVYASATLSSCANSVDMTYSWHLYLDGALISSVHSISMDPSAYLLIPYTLASGHVYTISVTATVPVSGGRASAKATTSRDIVVASGAVRAAIKGGSNLQILSNGVISLDASISMDENSGLLTNSSVVVAPEEMSYKWSCSFVSYRNYGLSCDSVLSDTVTNSSVLLVKGLSLNEGSTYAFSVLVTASDGRYDTARVTVSLFNVTNQMLSVNDTASTVISSKLTKFNPDSVLSLFGYVTAGCDIDASWLVFESGSALNISENILTPNVKLLPSTVVKQRTSFPLVILENTFSAGAILTFRLQAVGLNVDFVSFSEMSITVNSPPVGGIMNVVPPLGEALSTPFSLNTASWVDEPEDYPLSFSFSYSAVGPDDTNQLFIKSRNTLSSAASTLPAGSSSSNYSVYVITKAFDSYLAFSELWMKVTVTPTDIDVAEYLAGQLHSAFSSSNINQANSAISNAGSSLSTANCSLTSAAYCASKNRAGCTGLNTCGSCLTGFTGILGSSNTMCLNSSSSTGQIGQYCSTASDCVYGSCVNSVCVEPVKTCPSGCSGMGVCLSYDNAGNVMDHSCGLFDQFCSVSCLCSNGFGGADCSLDNSTSLTHDRTRFLLCQGIAAVANTSNPSLLLLQQLTNALAISFSPSETFSTATYLECINAFSSIAVLVNEGYLIGSSSTLAQSVIDLASKFVSPSLSGFAPSYSGNASFAFAISGILSGLEKSVASGQSGVSFSSSNVRITIRRDLAIDLFSNDLEAPASASELAYGYKSSKISLSPEIAAMCDSGNGYAKLSMLQWNNNPFSDSAVGSPILRTDAKTCSNSGARRRLTTGRESRELTDVWTNSSRTERNSDNSTLVGLFYITLQFITEQDFDFSIDPSSIVYEGQNTTFPECRMFDGTQFVPCEGCQISHYTNFNVTYACTDGSIMCGSCEDDSSVRALSIDSAVDELDDEDDAEHHIRLYYEALNRRVSSYTLFSQADSSVFSGGRRRLQSLSGDDDGSTSIGKVTSGQFTAMMSAVKTEIAIVLSFNPFSIDVVKAEPILIFVSILFFIILTGFIYFIRWDRFDHNMMVYSNQVNVQVALMMKKAMLDQQGSRYDDHKYQELKKFFEEKKEQLENRRKWYGAKKSKSFVAKRKCAVTGEYLEEEDSEYHNDTDGYNAANIGDENTERDFLVAAKEVGYDNILDIPSVNEDFVPTHDKFIVNTVAAFLGYVIPIASAGNSDRFLHQVANKHEYTSAFSDPSLYMNRTNRWLNVCMQVMLGLFLDTIFFGMFFPDQGLCESLHSESSCTAVINKATNLPMCSWIKDKSQPHTYKCSLNFPPNTMTFIVLVACLTILFAVPVSFLLDYLRIKICTRRPNFSQSSFCGKLMQSSTKFTVNEDNRHSTLHDLYDDINAKRNQDADYQRHLMSRTSEEYQQKALEEVNVLARKVYDGVTSSAEEVDQILNEVQQFLSRFVLTSKAPWNHSLSSEVVRTKATAIQRYIGVYPDGTPVPLSFFDLLYYGTAREKLRCKLLASRRRARRIASHLNKMGDIEANNKDMSLIQYFILEQFDPVKRYALRYQFFNFPVSTPNLIHPVIWVLTWAFMISVLLFFLYWTLAWGVQSGGRTFRAWGLNFILTFVEDVCLIQLVKIYVLFVLSMFSIRPQLSFIYATLNKVAIRYAQEGPSEDDSIKVVQHLSAACRAARTTVCKDLAAAKILSQIDDSDIRNCRKNGKTAMPAFAVFIVLIPAVLTLVFNDSFGEMVMSAILPSLFTIFLMINYYIYTASVIFLVIVWAVIASFLYWRFYRHRKLKRQYKMARDIKVSVDVVKQVDVIELQHHSHDNRLSYRSLTGDSAKKYSYFMKERSLDFFYWILRVIAYPVVYFRKVQSRVIHDHTPAMWSTMNYPLSMQGSTSFEVKDEDNEEPIKEFPFYVQNVMASEWRSEEWSESRKHDYVIGLLNKHLLNVRDEDLLSDKKTTLVAASAAIIVPHVLKKKKSMVPRSVRQRSQNGTSRMDLALVPSQDEDDSVSVTSGEEGVKSVITLESIRSGNKPNYRAPRRANSNSSAGSKPTKRNAKKTFGREHASWESEQGRDFRDKFTITTDEYVALRRMLLKHLGERNDYAGSSTEKKTLAEKVLDYEDFNELIKVTVLSSIMRDIFTIYYPAGVKVDSEELAGIMEDYTHWSETSRNIDDYGMVPFVVFQEWFVAMSHKVIKYRAVIEGFELSEDVDFLNLAGLSDVAEREEQLMIELSVNIFASVINYFCTQLCEALLTDRQNAIEVLCVAQCELMVNEVVAEMCSNVVLVQIGSIKDLVNELGTALVEEVVLDTLEELYWPVCLRVLDQAVDEQVQAMVLGELEDQVDDLVKVNVVEEYTAEYIESEVLDVVMEVYAEARVEYLEVCLADDVMISVLDEETTEIVTEMYTSLIEEMISKVFGSVVGEVTRELTKGLTIEAKLEYNSLLQDLTALLLLEFLNEEILSISTELVKGVDEELKRISTDRLVKELFEELVGEVVLSEVSGLTSKVKREILNIVELFAREEVIAEVLNAMGLTVAQEVIQWRDELCEEAHTMAEVIHCEVLDEAILSLATDVKRAEEAAVARAAAPPPRYLTKTQSFIIKEKPKLVRSPSSRGEW